MFQRFAKPPRLPFVTQASPLYFVTFCVMHRKRLLASKASHEAFCDFAREGLQKGVGVGQYVLMPDHVHLFIRMSGEMTLGDWVGGLKRAIGRTLCGVPGAPSPWQPGFFDHVLRHDESYAEKWLYVRDNPVRKGLVGKWEDWPYRGEITVIDRA